MVIKRVCECGMLVKGTSEKHLKANIKLHKIGKKHKELMEIIKERSEVKKK